MYVTESQRKLTTLVQYSLKKHISICSGLKLFITGISTKAGQFRASYETTPINSLRFRAS
jgi:hypothetical protein